MRVALRRCRQKKRGADTIQVGDDGGPGLGHALGVEWDVRRWDFVPKLGEMMV